jgi:phospholipid-binding lipoprotein MlaA
MKFRGNAGHLAVGGWKSVPHWVALLLCGVLAGCATGPNANPKDPLEPFNRGVYEFNDAIDRGVLKPVATAYKDVTPELVRRGVGNFFNNIEDAWSFVNNVLQFKAEGAATSLIRVGVNTFIGLGGILDVATEMRIERYTEDFGQTLGRWGVGAGPYIVLPFFGPSTLRDTVALPVDKTVGDPVTRIEDIPVRNTLWALRLIDNRAQLLKAGEVLDEVALDKYTFIRDSYLQRRRNAVFDGNPPEEEPEADPASGQ